MDGYGNFMMHQQQVPSSYYNQGSGQARYQNANGSYGHPSEWTGVPLIKSTGEPRHKKVYGSRSNGYDYDESSMSRLAKHAHGAPIIMSNRFRSKSTKPMQAFGENGGGLRNQNGNGFVKTPAPPSPDGNQSYDEAGYHGNGTCLPRIIKPRKRRKKDRKPIAGASMENNPPSPFTFASNQSGGFMQTASANSSSFQSQMNENFKRPAPPNDSNLFFNCDFDPSIVLPLPSSTSSSPISLSSSSLSSSTTTSSCSCRLCDPNCKIWAFPLRRSFSDNSAVEMDHHSSDVSHSEASRKDVGVIGGNRVKTEWNSAGESTLSILDMIEFNDYGGQQKLLMADVNRLRSESLSDSGDSGCDLLLGGLHISDDILSSTIKTVGEGLTSEGLNAITRKLTEFSLMAAATSHTSDAMAKEIGFGDRHQNHLDVNESSMPPFAFNTITKSLSSCEFGDHQQQQQQRHHRSNLDNLLAMSSNGGNCNYGNLMSPMLVNKQTFSNNLDLNNNHHGPAPAVDGANDALKERTLFDCFDASWKGS
jgi:hypothetical protein